VCSGVRRAQVPHDLATKLLPYRIDEGAKLFQQLDAGAEIDWVALAKGRHEYKEKVKRGEVGAL
jgi:hypothetical protein